MLSVPDPIAFQVLKSSVEGIAMSGIIAGKDPLYEIWLSLCLDAGSTAYGELFPRFSSAYEIYRADSEELAEAGIPERISERLLNKDLDPAWRCMDFCSKEGIGVIVRGWKGYPERLADIPNPPFLLYYKGHIPDMDSKICTAMVGTRSMSEYGMKMAYKIGYELGAAGAVVVSGMAKGVDSVSACGALEAGGVTVAVSGCGLDRAYPLSHKALMRAISEKGAVISEYPPGSLPVGSHFPVRNRIISGLCQGTLVVEAGEKSGSMITAREAIRQGRAIYALPGNIGAENTAGTNSLIRDGARIVLGARDILSDFLLMYGDTVNKDALVRAMSCSDIRDGVLGKYGVDGAGSLSGRCGHSDPKTTLSHSDHYANATQACALTHKADQKTKKHRFLFPERASKAKDTETGNEITESQINKNSPAELVSAETALPPPPEGKLRQVYDLMIKGKKMNPDDFSSLGYPVGDVVGTLSMLEIMGYVESAPGGVYIRRS